MIGRARLVSGAMLALGAVGVLAGTLSAQAAPLTAAPIYDSTLSPVPPNVFSLGFQATQTKEFGDLIQFAGTNRRVTTATVTMSDWAKASEYPLLGASPTWSHPITLNVYAVNNSGPTPAAGALLGTVTQTFAIPWRPEADPTCGGTAYRAADNNCYNGVAFNITFNLSSLNLTLPNQVIWGVAFNTQSYGSAPTGVPGPYNSLNVGLNDVAAPSVGTDVNPDAVFWNTSTATNYTDGGPGGTFRQDTAWAPYVPMIRFDATPVPVGPPTNKDQCKKDGWQSFNNPSFKNQGDCVSYTNNGK